MNNIHSYQDNIDLPDSGGLTHAENYSGSTSSAYGEVSPHMQNSTPGSNDSIYDKNNNNNHNNPSTGSSKKSKSSQISIEDHLNNTIESLEKTITDDKMSKIKEIIALITELSDREKMLLQLQFPISDNDSVPFDSTKVEFNMNFDALAGGVQNEHGEALTWVMSHLEENKSTCLQKQEVYEDYKSYCMSHNIKCLSTADFGKVMKKVFPNIKARRLGARGQSRYCYSGLRNRQEIQSPMLSDVAIILEGNDNKHDNNTNSEVESYSSTSVQNDLSNVPEFELSPKILVDSALVIIDFVKQSGLNKNLMSLKQVVRHLLANNQVDIRSPHALRLLSTFQQMENQKQYPVNKYPVDQNFNTIKKEETLSSPCSGTQRSSTASPQNIKRREMFASPIPNKISSYCDRPKLQSDNSPVPAPQSCSNPRANFNYSQHYYNTNMSSSMLPMSQLTTMPHNNIRTDIPPIFHNSQPKSFIHSTPVKNTSIIEGPQLNSPLLDNNPLTTKKLELPKMMHTNNNSVNFPVLHEKSGKIPFFNSSNGYATCDANPYDTSSSRRPQKSVYTSIDSHQDVSSPHELNMFQEHMIENDEFQNLAQIDATMPLQMRFMTDNYTELDFRASPRTDHYSNYSLTPTNYSSTQSPKNAKRYLNTPDNSPRNNDIDLPEFNSNHNLSTSINNHMAAKNDSFLLNNKSNCKSVSYVPFYPSMNQGVVPAYTNDRDSMNRFPNHFSISHRFNDESNVSSTTNTGLLDQDGHPSTTMILHTNYK